MLDDQGKELEDPRPALLEAPLAGGDVAATRPVPEPPLAPEPQRAYSVFRRPEFELPFFGSNSGTFKQ